MLIVEPIADSVLGQYRPEDAGLAFAPWEKAVHGNPRGAAMRADLLSGHQGVLGHCQDGPVQLVVLIGAEATGQQLRDELEGF